MDDPHASDPGDTTIMREGDGWTKMAPQETSSPGLLAFSALAGCIGIVAGLFAVAFRLLIAFFHNLFFAGQVSITYSEAVYSSLSPWGPFVIVVPVLGAVGVVFIARHFSLQVLRSGIPDVLNCIYYEDGTLARGLAVFRTLASALSIGTGAPVGREGSVFQVGAAIASTAGEWLSLSRERTRVLMTAGGTGGIAATFNTPVGGILFGLELALPRAGLRDVIPLLVASAAATYIGRYFLGFAPFFVLANSPAAGTVEGPFVLLLSALLGGMLGIVSALFLKSVYRAEDLLERCFGERLYLRHGSGMLIVGVLIYLTTLVAGRHALAGGGYYPVHDILSGSLSVLSVLLVLFLLKFVSTSVALGSGASGGVFFPALFLGAAFGSIYGILLAWLFPNLPLDPQVFILSGMAGVLGATTGAVLAAIVMIFEMTLDFAVLAPATVVVLISYGVRRLFVRGSIYTLALAREGRQVPEALDAASIKNQGRGLE
jgi:CIC family chloride channel protein